MVNHKLDKTGLDTVQLAIYTWVKAGKYQHRQELDLLVQWPCDVLGCKKESIVIGSLFCYPLGIVANVQNI